MADSLPRDVREAGERVAEAGRPGLVILSLLARSGNGVAARLLGDLLAMKAEGQLPAVTPDPLDSVTPETLLRHSWGWMRRAAEAGDTDAMQVLSRGHCAPDSGLKYDPEAGLAWLHRAVAAGDLDAAQSLAQSHYYAGRYEEAAGLAAKSAAAGNARAHAVVAVSLAETGQTERALSHVLVARRLGAGQGCEWGQVANRFVEALEAELAPGEIKAARAEAESWRPMLS